jgi:hypothetical protein
MSALRDKTPYGDLFEDDMPEPERVTADERSGEAIAATATVAVGEATDGASRGETEIDDGASRGETETDDGAGTPSTLREHVRAVIDAETESARLLDADFGAIETVPAGEAFDAVNDAKTAPYALVLDGQLTQRLLDVAAQRGVEHVVARSAGEMVKTPVDVRVRTVDQFATAD